MAPTRDAPSPIPVAHQPASATRKWMLLSGFWGVQAVIAYLVAAVWITLNANSGGSAGPLYGFDFSEFVNLLYEPDWATPTIIGIVTFTILQGMFLLPVYRPRANLEGRGTSLWLSAASAAVTVALLWGALIASVIGALQLVGAAEWTSVLETPSLWVLLGLVAFAWVIATPLLATFISRGRRESRLARLSATLFLGTVVESVAIMPLDVMARRRTDCYCDTGTFWALSACGTVGLFVLGPAIFLPLLARRRRRWYLNRCDACGYDMSAILVAPRCPECGAGWRTAK